MTSPLTDNHWDAAVQEKRWRSSTESVRQALDHWGKARCFVARFLCVVLGRAGRGWWFQLVRVFLKPRSISLGVETADSKAEHTVSSRSKCSGV